MFMVSSKPKMSHLEAVKRIIRYVKGTVNLGVFYSKGSNGSLVGYCDADWGGSVDDQEYKWWMFLSRKQYDRLVVQEAEYCLQQKQSTLRWEVVAHNSCG